ncbi:hypothetical protein [Kitasatospora cineracea]|uniref:Uncharacterized protein n=1 Tax=Kitasatospora cineracea TaxID=88074 RepID=A0A8G1XCY0_9ACTN|nr:hypothetical protein [Kitasatospora cineracea]ROR43656.1 hypothetical protein EDD39_1822 [Kitasatospora cineracea]
MPFRSRHPRTLLAYAALLDHSIERIAEVSADAREFDREEIYRLTDVWDNNTAALFAAAAARFRWTRALQACWALRWMADFSPVRRAWMVEQTAAAGVPVERLLRRPVPEPTAPGQWHRFYRGCMTAELNGSGSELTEGLAAEYDLPAAAFLGLMVERRGADRLDGWCEFELPRRYAGGGPRTARLTVSFEDPEDLRFDGGRDTTGLSLEAGPDGVVLRLGATGVLRCRSVRLNLDDDHWEDSPTGRRFAAAHPERRERHGVRQWILPVLRSAGGPADAGRVLRAAMIAARRVRFAGAAADAPLRAVTTALAGAGPRILAAGAVRRRADRNAAFEALVADWFRRGGPDFAEAVTGYVTVPEELRPVGPPARPTVRALPARLALVLYRLPSTPVEYSHPAYARLCFAQPSANDPDAPWTLRSRGFGHPVALAFTLDAFRHTAVPDLAPDRLAFGPHLTATGTPDPY